MRKASKLCVWLVLWAWGAAAQPELVDRDKYPFIDYKQNKLYVPAGSGMDSLYGKLDRLLVKGDKQINIVQIGDSHIQADFFSGKLRERFQTFFPGGNGGRGFVFPYTMARTNNPINYKVSYTGNWTGCRNVEATKQCVLGLSGISVTTWDSTATFTLSVTDRSGLPYDFTRIRIFYFDTASNYTIALENEGSAEVQRMQTDSNVSEWTLEPASAITVRISRDSSYKSSFTLLGVALETDDPGIVYHAIGVNGADVDAFLRCSLLEYQLKELKPDLVIFSLGTNDAYVANFDEKAFTQKYTELLRRIRKENPGVPILLTTPGDNYRRRRYLNYSNIKAKDAIFAIAKKNKYVVWDFFTVMGGLKSIQDWYMSGLTARDKVHLSRAGYELQADLLFEAFIDAYENYNREGGE